jgi:Flp pilus assembly protein TadD
LPDDVHVAMALSWCYKRIGRLEEAITTLEHAVDVDPGEAVLHYNLACYWSLAHNRRRALQHLAHALDIDGNFRDLVSDEPDFDPIRNDPLFQSLTAALG